MKCASVKCVFYVMVLMTGGRALAATEVIDGIEWNYWLYGDHAEVWGDDRSAGVSPEPVGHVVIPSMLGGKPVKDIGYYLFYCCNEITGVTIPFGVTEIGLGTFYGCSQLASITIPDEVKYIGEKAFYGCSQLSSITIPNNVIRVGEDAFYNCKGLAKVSIGNNVKHIGYRAFYCCNTIPNLIIPTSVTNIDVGAFYNCSSLTNVTISDGVVKIGNLSFYGCRNLLGFSVSIGNRNYKDENGLLLTKDGKTLVVSPGGLTNVVVPEGVTYIGEKAFYGCTKLLSVTMPDSITDIGNSAFENCKGLVAITIPDNVRTIGNNAFYNCTGLSEISMPDSVLSIGQSAFGACGGLKTAYIPKDYTGSTSCFPYGTVIIRCKQYQNVAFNVMGGEPSFDSKIVKFGMAYGALPIPSRVGYSFVGWEYDGEVVSEETIVSATDDHALTANWHLNKYVVTFNGNGGVGGWRKSLNYGSSIDVPNVTRTGFTFTGWIPTAPSSVPASNVTCSAQWQINQYTIVFDTKGGTSASPITQDYATAVAAPANPTRTGHTFTGWSPAVPPTMPASDTTCVAQWKINQYTISFNSAGGTSASPITQDYATAVAAPANPTRTGHTFTGWSPAVPPTMPASDTTCVAQWKINKHLVIFDAKGGSGGWSKSLDYGSTITPPTVSRDDYTFVGWLPEPGATVPDHDVTYVAQWKIWDITVVSADSKMKDLYPDDYQHITNIVIEASVTSLPDNFFEGCDALEKVTFLSSDTELGNNDLRNVGRLFANQPDGYWIVQGVLLGYKGVCPRKIPNLDAVKRVFDGALEGCTALEELTFTAESVLTTIGTNAFKHCTELRQMTLPPSLTEIGDEAFMGCSYLGNVIVPGSVKKVGDRAFKNCTGFTAAQIEYGVESLGEEAFCGDWRISEVDIPSTVTNIGINAFGGDSSIIRIGLRGDVRKAKDIFSNYKIIREATVKEGTGEVVDGLFSGFEKLRDVRFFGNCPQLENDGQLLYAMTPGKSDDNAGLTTYVEANSTGWDGTPGSHSLPQAWPLAGGSRRAIAYWDVPSYLCQFESNGGTLGVQDTYQYSEKPFMLPPEPVQSGYKFAGWWTKPVGGLHVTSDTIFIEGVYTMLYAHWIKGHWVFLDPNGGTVVNDYVTYVEETTYGVLPSPVRSGYAFNGWLYNDVVIEPTTVISDKNDHTLVAQWTANLYSVRYHANGGVGNMADESRTYGVEKALRKNIFVNGGYTFVGWATNETDEIIYSDCEVVSNMTAVANGWINLYAVWEESDIKPDPSNLNFYFSGDANWERCAEGVEVEKDGETLRYDSVWKSGFITNNQTSVLAADVYGAGKIGFWWKVSCESFRNLKLDNLEFAIDGVPQEPWINGETDWQYLEFELNETGPHTLTWTYCKDESDDGMDVGEDCGRVTAAVWTPALKTLGDYVNSPQLEFESRGNATWFGDLEVSHDGIASLRSGVIGDNEVSSLETEVAGTGRIGFWWKVSSEAFRQVKIDYVSFCIDGVEQAWIGGNVDWTNVAFNVVGEGTHILTWEYHKDTEGSAGEDCTWLDEVIWMPSGGAIPELTPAQAAAWVSEELATRYAKSGESTAGYQNRFEAKFGTDPVAAMSMPTDKKDAQGNNMYVWQDYVAGTDPTDTNSVFTAKVDVVDGVPVITWSPELPPEQTALRTYTIYGKTNLTDKAWHAPTNAASRFFKIGVKMKGQGAD